MPDRLPPIDTSSSRGQRFPELVRDEIKSSASDGTPLAAAAIAMSRLSVKELHTTHFTRGIRRRRSSLLLPDMAEGTHVQEDVLAVHVPIIDPRCTYLDRTQ